jgi:hypothetical protein
MSRRRDDVAEFNRYTFHLRVPQTTLGPFDTAVDGFLVERNAASSVWILNEPQTVGGFISVPPSKSFLDDLWPIGFPLSVNGLFVPARFDRWWILSTAAMVNPLVLHTFTRLWVPSTR